MLKSKKVLVLLVVLLLVIGAMSFAVKATDTPIDLGDLLNSTSDANTTTNETANATTNETANETTTNTTGGNVLQPALNSTQSGNDLPQTGVTEDITVMFFIVVCVILAIYAYKKIRDYKS